MTLEAWVYPTAQSGFRTVILKERPGELAYALYARESAARPSTWITAGTSGTAAGTTALPLSTWTHLAATYDAAVLRLYVNGVQVGSRPKPVRSLSPAVRCGSVETRFGASNLAGRIDEVRIYARALSATEIQTDMNTAVAPPVSDTTPPTAAITSPAPNAAVSGTTGTYANAYLGTVSAAVEADGALMLRLGPNGARSFPLTHFNRDLFIYYPYPEMPDLAVAATFAIGPGRKALHLTLDDTTTAGRGSCRAREIESALRN